MSTRRRSSLNNGMSKTLRDYLVPIIGLFLVILLMFSFFSGGGDNDLNDTIKYENQVPLNVMLDTDITEAYVIYPGENKVQMEGDKEIYKGEKIWVKEGSVSINFLSVGDFKLNKLGEFLYSEDGELYLNSSDLFINSKTDLIINMKYAKVLIGKNSTVSLSQNEMSSNISLLYGNVEVRNLSGESSVLAKGQMISISRLEASSDDLDLSMNKTEIDDFFKSSDWFIKNNGAFYLSRSDVDEEDIQTGSTIINKTNNSLISFNNLTDESYVSSNMLNISGKYSDEDITSISVNGTEATLDSNTKTFNFKNISVSDFENDLVFKIYDDSNDLLEKFIYVVYYKSSTSNSNSVFQVVNYNVDGSQFTFTEPSSSSTFTTTATFITIRGLVNTKGIDKVSVNDFVLSSFNGSTWRYHADVKYNNLQDGTNVYTVKYYDANGKLVYTNNYTIIKKPIQVEVPEISEVKDTQTYSDEVSVD